MKELLETIADELRAGGRTMLATIIGKTGSVPRGIGTSMTVSDGGIQTGTVGGGAMEYSARLDAMAMLKENACGIRDYKIHADGKEVLSGGIRILFRPFSGEEGQRLAQRLLNAVANAGNEYWVIELSESLGSASELLDGTELCVRFGIGASPERPIVSDGDPAFLIVPLKKAPRVVLFGGGHVAQVTARQLALLDFRIWVIEDRAEFAKGELFPAAERVILSGYESVEDMVRLTDADHAIVMTRGHETDYLTLRWVLRSEADYIGCVGSKRKIALTRDRLLEDGLMQERIDRLHAPIGLNIGAETPAEIAVSIAAELIQYRAKKRERTE